jgi:multidrug efflux pump subunit AcrB
LKEKKKIESFLLFKKNKSRENTLERLRKLKLRREGQLLASGYSPAESSFLAEEEFGEHSAVAKEELNSSIDKVVLEVENLRIENENGGVETVVKNRKERILQNENDFLNLLDSVREKERKELSDQTSSSSAILQAARDASRRSAETAANHLQNIRNMHEKEQKRLKEIFNAKKMKESASLQKKLMESRKKRKEELLQSGLSELEIENKMNSDDPETLALNLESENLQLKFLAEFKVRFYNVE